MTPLKIAPAARMHSRDGRKIDALNRKLGSFIHAPLNLKEILRMEPFAADGEVVRAVAASLDDYAILPTSPEERERQRTTGLPKDYDIVGFWYCVALLALSAEPEAVRYLLVLARMLMVEDPAELFLLRRIVRLLEGFPFPPPAGTQRPDRSLLRHRYTPVGSLPVAGGRRDSVARVIRMGGHRAVLLRRRALCRPGGPEGGAAPARGADAPAEQPPQPLRQLPPAQQLSEISLRNDDNTTRGLWNEGHGDLFIDDRPVMQHRMFTPLQLPELFDALEGFGIRLVRKPVMVYTSQGIRNAHVKVFQMLENQLGHDPTAIGEVAEAPGLPKAADATDATDGTLAGKSQFPEVEQAVEEALDLLKYDGDVNDSLAEMRKKWGEGISVLHEARFDEIGVQYACRSHEEGTCCSRAGADLPRIPALRPRRRRYLPPHVATGGSRYGFRKGLRKGGSILSAVEAAGARTGHSGPRNRPRAHDALRRGTVAR